MPSLVAVKPIVAKPLKATTLTMQGISKQTMEEHFKLYEGYINKTNEIRQKLEGLTVDPAKANQTYSEIRELKVELSFALGGVKNHELYFGHLGGHGGEPTGKLADLIRRDFGSFENWKTDLKASGIAARGWVWLAYDWADGHFYNYIGDAQNSYPIWDATPILGLDTYEHAYWIDYGSARAKYIDTFFNVVDWDQVARNLSVIEDRGGAR